MQVSFLLVSPRNIHIFCHLCYLHCVLCLVILCLKRKRVKMFSEFLVVLSIQVFFLTL